MKAPTVFMLEIVLMATLAASSACSRTQSLFSCDTEVAKEIPSPDGAFVAVVYRRDCGATTGFNTQVGLRRSRTEFDHDLGQVAAIGGQHDLKPLWTSTRHLTIPMPAGKVYRQLSKWKEVQIGYGTGPQETNP